MCAAGIHVSDQCSALDAVATMTECASKAKAGAGCSGLSPERRRDPYINLRRTPSTAARLKMPKPSSVARVEDSGTAKVPASNCLHWAGGPWQPAQLVGLSKVILPS